EAQIATGEVPIKTGGLLPMVNGKPAEGIAPSEPPPAGDQWFDLEIIAIGPTVRVLVNGKETAKAEGLNDYPRGRIALQVDGRNTTVEFASIAVKEIRAATPKSAVPRDEEIAALKKSLQEHEWHYHDSLYPPGDLCRFNENGTF